MWARDASLWTSADEGRRLGWLAVTDDQLAQIDHLRLAADDVRAAGFTHAVLLGMGGTVLGAEALARTFGRVPGFPELHVLDSIDPAQIRHRGARDRPRPRRCSSWPASRAARWSRTSSSSTSSRRSAASSARPRSAAGSSRSPIPGRRCSTSPRPTASGGSSSACRRMGGRFSALSDFGMVPGRHHGAGRRAPARPGRRDGAQLRGQRAGRGEPRRRARHPDGRAGRARAAPRSRWSSRRPSRRSAPGSSSCSPPRSASPAAACW